ncbi:MAG: hypothetical protein CMJ68_01745 [Planctomycetaceae bacterium]|nr:hypothetical protein [Planctomycetaceae bacterium]|tara:strand:+ start:1532 stop:2530 length:999 start_codon:yes stop_codon:yes gene_type:complete
MPNHLNFRHSQLVLLALVIAGTLVTDPAGLLAQDKKTAAKKTEPAKKADKTATKTTRRQRPADALREARGKLKTLIPFQAEIVETVVVRGKKFRATGKYMQGQGNKLRLEFDLEVGRTKGALVQVCDGTTLYTQQKIGVAVQATKRDVPRILNELKRMSSGPRPRPGEFEADLGLGGLAALLESLDQSMSFIRQREQTFQKRPFVIIEGTWNATFLEKLTDDDQADDAGLPEYVPDRVRVYIDKTTRFPHRIVYLKKATGQKVLRPMVSLEFRNVQVNAPLTDASFVFKPDPSVRVQDVTNAFIQQIKQQVQSGGAAASGESGRTGNSPSPR